MKITNNIKFSSGNPTPRRELKEVALISVFIGQNLSGLLEVLNKIARKRKRIKKSNCLC